MIAFTELDNVDPRIGTGSTMREAPPTMTERSGRSLDVTLMKSPG